MWSYRLPPSSAPRTLPLTNEGLGERPLDREIVAANDHARPGNSLPVRDSGWRWPAILRSQTGAVAACMMGAAALLDALLIPKAALADRARNHQIEKLCPAEIEARNAIARAAKQPLGLPGRKLIRGALDIKLRPSADHPFVRHTAEVRAKLERLGLLVDSPDHLHIADVDLEHGGAVARTAAGLNPYVRSVTSTMSVGDPPREVYQRALRPDQFKRMAEALLPPGETETPDAPTASLEDMSLDDAVRFAVDELEMSVLQKKVVLFQLREEIAKQPGIKRLFVNMSFGQSPDRVASEIAKQLYEAPEGSAAYKLVVKALGEAPAIAAFYGPEDDEPYEAEEPEPPRSCDAPAGPPPDLGPEPDPTPEQIALGKKIEAQIVTIKKKLVYPRLRRAMRNPGFLARYTQARMDLTREVRRGRAAGIFPIEAAGNEYADAELAGDPRMSRSTTANIKGLVQVGALDMGKFSTPKDDRIAEFSAIGPVDFSTEGVHVPVWIEGNRIVDAQGTSFSSPDQAKIAVAVAAVALGLDVDRIDALLRDPRVVHNIRGTSRDGVGATDAFAAILVARNPKITRAQIDEAWKKLDAPDVDVAALRRSLGLVAD